MSLVVLMSAVTSLQAKVFTGEVTLEQLSGVQETVLDLTGATLKEGEEFRNVYNHFVEYIALPMGMGKAEVQAISFAGFTNLKAAGSLTELPATGWSKQYAIAVYQREGNNLLPLMRKTRLLSILGGDVWGSASKIREAYFAGKCSAQDYAIWNKKFDSDGHYAPRNGRQSSNLALFGAQSIRVLDLEHADLDGHSEDLSFTALGYSSNTVINKVVLPTDPDITTIPSNFIANLNSITDICIPGNFKVISSGAFQNCLALRHIYTTPGKDEDNPREAGYYDHGDHTITLPASIEYIGKNAFSEIDRKSVDGSQGITDVYVLAAEAPKCELGAFDSGITMANNVWPQAPIQRSSYVSGGYTAAILHYPSGLSKEQQERYTDITRTNSLADETGATHKNGRLIIWPSQDELARAYSQAGKGRTWLSEDTTRVNEWNDKMYEDWKRWAQGPTTRAAFARYLKTSWGNYGSFTNKSGRIVDETAVFDTDYAGWHQFALATEGEPAGTEEENSDEYVQKSWYSFCVPMDIRRSQLLKYFGNGVDKYPDLVTLIGVTRDDSNYHITLNFSKNLINQDVDMHYNNDDRMLQYGEHGEVVYKEYEDEDPVVVHRGRPYLIRPWFNVSDGQAPAFSSAVKWELATKASKDNEGKSEADESVDEHGLDTHWIVKAVDQNGNVVYDEENNGYYTYQFIGSYNTNNSVPKWSLFISSNRFYWVCTNTPIATPSYGSYIVPRPGAVTVNNVGTDKPLTFSMTSMSDEFVTSSGAKITRMTGETYNFEEWAQSTTNDISGIDSELDGKGVKMSYGKIYDLQGRYMGTDASRLKAGVYIINGKKITIK